MKLLQLPIWYHLQNKGSKPFIQFHSPHSPPFPCCWGGHSASLSGCRLCSLTVNQGPTSLRQFFTIIVASLCFFVFFFKVHSVNGKKITYLLKPNISPLLGRKQRFLGSVTLLLIYNLHTENIILTF